MIKKKQSQLKPKVRAKNNRVKKTQPKPSSSKKVRKSAVPAKKKTNNVSKKSYLSIASRKKAEIPQKVLSITPRKQVASALVHTEPAVDYIHVNKSFHDHYQLPNVYEDETRVCLLARDPHWVYAYWEIAQRSWDELKQKIGDEINYTSHVLRVYDVTFVNFNGSNANNYFDVEVGHQARNWYVNLWKDDASYCVEFGLKTRDGRFWPIGRSNFVQTPRAHPSYRGDLIWMEVEQNKQSTPFIYLRRRNNGAAQKRRRFFLLDDELRAFFAKYFQLLKQLIWQRLKSQVDSMDDIEIEGVDFSIDDLLEGEEIDGITQKGFVGSSEEWQKMLRRRRRKKLPGESEEFGGPGSSGLTSSGSWQLQEKENNQPRKFFFEIGTELIVYGRTEPDAKVTLEGKPVILRPDGTFSMRFALHDGKIPLSFVAESSNKIDKRQISTSVIRTQTKHK